ncbi:beta-galactosidase [Dactylonectria macrodidyma]|uniref:Beta-galactosidase n=1 Tax=Dactylonectria macrodidyma TaxID=307937 RepID=A0A9P9I984_9HYPO|nr:beta-galactosidase [Dactylonectria macrodidyma]
MDDLMFKTSFVIAKVLRLLCWALITQPLISSAALSNGVRSINSRTLHQDIVTWDQYSVKVHGERVLLLSGEFHPFRLPSPGLWLDVFQKIRALGFSATSFYLDWALLEGERGHIRTDGIFSLREFISAAQEAGVYLIARPGPYINAEVSGGGFPGWLQRIPGRLRNIDPSYLDAITPFMLTVGRMLAKEQITNGGPIILFQPENEYSICDNQTEPGYIQANNVTLTNINAQCLNKPYMAYVEKQFRKAGIVVPFIVNDAFPRGNFAPGTGAGAGDIYSFDFYPLGWSTAPSDPSNWTALFDPRIVYNSTVHQNFSPTTPFSISEFQGGAPDAWGGVGVETTAAYVSAEFERIFYKLNYGFRATIHNLYMIFGGTNWGNLGHPSGYTSYDVGAAIAEDRRVHREKYSELKLQSSFLQASPAYLTTHPDNGSYGVYTDARTLAVTRLAGKPTNFYIVRHGVLATTNSTSYKLKIPTSIGKLVVPQLGGTLSLHGRDSKIHVVDYDVGGTRLIYSTAEVFSWKKAGSKSVLVLYGGANERHEFAVPANMCGATHIEGKGVHIKKVASACVAQWEVKLPRRVVSFGNKLEVHLLWRNDAYNYWVLDLPAPGHLGLHAHPSRAEWSVIVKAGYLMRSATISGSALHLTGDINATTEVELITAPRSVSSIFFNGQKIKTAATAGRLRGNVHYDAPHVSLPNLRTLHWRYLDSLPEVRSGYDDSQWTRCNKRHSNNPRNLTTPTSLYSSDYGYNGGSLLYRGTFVANGSESSLYILTEGGYAYGHSVWLDSTHISSWPGTAATMFSNETLKFPTLKAGRTYVVTILIDHLGNDENFIASQQLMKDPRGVIDYSLNGRDKEAISWKMTGNLGGEHYHDLSRGPLNEGGLYAERQGYHLPGAPTKKWKSQSPFDGVSGPGVAFFATSLPLDLPAGYDIPISLVFTNSTNTKSSAPANFRAQIFVNGWQFGKYINNIGPQLSYPIPEGILDHNGINHLSITLWSMDGGEVKLDGLTLKANAVIQSAYKKPDLVRGQPYSRRHSY